MLRRGEVIAIRAHCQAISSNNDECNARWAMPAVAIAKISEDRPEPTTKTRQQLSDAEMAKRLNRVDGTCIAF